MSEKTHRSSTQRGDRIAPLDGLRAIAVGGVFYAHAWSFVLARPPLRIVGVDVNRVLALFGTGVDLFFVISGFCMYLMYGSRESAFSLDGFLRFVRNRFWRIAPAFYASVLVSATFVAMREHRIPWRDVAAHLAFASTLVPDTSRLAASFWSLATEWHFYLVLPGLAVAVQRLGFRSAMFLAMALGVLARVVLSGVSVPWYGLVPDHLFPARLVEFGWGIIAARWYLSGAELPRWLTSTRGFVAGWAVSLIGRAMMTSEAGALPGGRWLQVGSLIVLSFGYMLVVLSVVTNTSTLAARALASAPMRWLGRISYSIYLWHWDVGLGVVGLLATRLGIGAWSPIVYFLLSLAVVLPIAHASYRWLEAPYFKRRAGRSNNDGGPQR